MSTSSARYHHGNLRETLLRAAERIIDVEVSRVFSLRELAREAGVSHAAPYRHFSDRAELVVALAERWMAEFVAVQRAAVDADDPRRSLLALGSAYVGYAERYPSRFFVLFDPAVNRPDEPPTPGFATSVAEHTALLRGAVEDAVAAGVLPDGDVEAVAAALWSQVHGLATLVTLGYLPAAETVQVLGALLRTRRHR